MSDDQFLRDLLTDVHPARPAFRAELRDHLSDEWNGRTTIAPSTTEPTTAAPRRQAWWTVSTAAAVIALVVAGLAWLNRPDDPAAPRTDTSPTLPSTSSVSTAPATRVVTDTTTPAPTALDFPPLTETFVSPRHGYSIKYPQRGTVTPAEQLWGFSERVDDGFDVVETGSAAVFKVASRDASTPGPEEAPIDERIDVYLSQDDVLPGGCGVPREQQAEIIIDGQPGRIAECSNHVEATVVVGGRLYLFTLSHGRSDARAVFDTFIATVDLTPDAAVEFPPMTRTFVSPTYGYSLRYPERGGSEPATEIWDAAIQPPIEILDWDPRFDGFETGLGAYFQSASTPIPDGVPIDEWVDASVTLGGCGVPRSEQAEIVIDGQTGRVARCGHSEATVVADGRLYLFIGPNDDRRWFEGWIATIDLTPETAAS
jgi:hypothetical protein